MSVRQIRVYRFFWRTASPVLVPIQDSPLAHPDGKVPAYDMLPTRMVKCPLTTCEVTWQANKVTFCVHTYQSCRVKKIKK